MEITIYNRTNEDVQGYQALFEKIGAAAEKQLHLSQTCEISVTFVRSAAIHKINRDYRGIDRPTDVISFAINDSPDLIDDGEKDLGDLFIDITIGILDIDLRTKLFCHRDKNIPVALPSLDQKRIKAEPDLDLTFFLFALFFFLCLASTAAQKTHHKKKQRKNCISFIKNCFNHSAAPCILSVSVPHSF